MKKFLLVAVIALISISASAVNRQRAPKFMNTLEKKELLATPGAFKSYAAKQEAMNAFYSGVQMKESKAAAVTKASSRRADEELTLIPCYSQWTYFYNNLILGGFMPQIMYDGASYLVDGEKAYFAPFANLGSVEGTINADAENPYAEIGAVVYTFTSGVIAKYTDKETGEVVDLTLEPCVVENYKATRSTEKTFDAYYLADSKELYIPSSVCLALFEANSTDVEVFDDYYVARMLDLIPKSEMDPYISKGTFVGTSYYGASNNVSGDCQIFLGDGFFCVKGADGSGDPDCWVEFDIDETDNTIASVFENQFIGQYNFYTDNTHTATQPGIVVTVGLLQSDGTLTAFNAEADYASFYKITDNPDETTTISNTANTVYGNYVYMENDGGMYNAIDLSVNITYEAIETGIKTVADTNKKIDGNSYNLSGQRVDNNFKGIVIKDGRKFMNK